ncbi:MAG: replication restart helicase PriA [Deltaproteobacteria bacterium]|nr:replication restart helicase PriA [Deltaproteobacteria bacterium]
MHEPQKFARVVIPSPLRQPLIYAVPASLQAQIALGMRVLIPLQKRITTGIVIETLAENPLASAKEIFTALDDQPILDAGLLKLAHWTSQYYLASLGEVLATMLPPNSRRESKRTVVLKADHSSINDELGQKVLQEIVQRKGKIPVTTLTRQFPGENIDRVLGRLEAAGAIVIEDRLAKQRRKAGASAEPKETSIDAEPLRFQLTSEQEAALGAIGKRITQGGFETFLLHGVTGSGKTEVYLRAIAQARSLGRRSLIIVPEISLTPQLLDRVNARFPGKVGVLHSAMTAAERWSQWWRIIRGNVAVVIGARSAVFAPIPDLGLIIVDEEHDSSYKQEDGLRYNGRDLAVVRGKFLHCAVILGSATPALESYVNCRQGRYQLIELNQRVEERPMPAIEVIDLRQQFRKTDAATDARSRANAARTKTADRPLLSESFVRLLRQNLAAKHQTLIFLNRRGFANFLQCTLCGHVWRCSYCSVTLTLHLKLKILTCHHCDYRRPTTNLCPECKNESLTPVGAGTEQVETTLQQLIPEARIARMDRDTTGKRGSQEALIRRWERGELDILVGTQMITKGHDVSGVTLVGALLADLSLNLPDFRAAERTFQLLSQVAGRSGRGDDPGRVIIQTYAPDHYALEFLIAHDYKGFFAAESEFRRALNYPPYGRLVNLRLDGPKMAEVEQRAQALAAGLRELQHRTAIFREQIEVLGPAPAPIEKLRNRFRWQLLLKGKQSAPLLDFARHARALIPRSPSLRLHIDVDPYSML